MGGVPGGFIAVNPGNGREWGESGLQEFLELRAIIGYKPVEE